MVFRTTEKSLQFHPEEVIFNRTKEASAITCRWGDHVGKSKKYRALLGL